MCSTAAIVRMPETPMYKNHLPPGCKDKVRFSWEVFLVQSVTVAHFMDQAADRKLGTHACVVPIPPACTNMLTAARICITSSCSTSPMRRRSWDACPCCGLRAYWHYDPLYSSAIMACSYSFGGGRLLGAVKASATWSMVVVDCPPSSSARICPSGTGGPMSYRIIVTDPAC